VGGIYWIAEKVVSAPEGHSPNVRENLDKVEPAA
jgi:hypothetical protein